MNSTNKQVITDDEIITNTLKYELTDSNTGSYCKNKIHNNNHHYAIIIQTIELEDKCFRLWKKQSCITQQN